jgi:hypothetical protein
VQAAAPRSSSSHNSTRTTQRRATWRLRLAGRGLARAAGVTSAREARRRSTRWCTRCTTRSSTPCRRRRTACGCCGGARRYRTTGLLALNPNPERNTRPAKSQKRGSRCALSSLDHAHGSQVLHEPRVLPQRLLPMGMPPSTTAPSNADPAAVATHQRQSRGPDQFSKHQRV